WAYLRPRARRARPDRLASRQQDPLAPARWTHDAPRAPGGAAPAGSRWRARSLSHRAARVSRRSTAPTTCWTTTRLPHREKVAKRPDDPFHPLATRIVAARKLIFSRTLDAVEWPNTEIIRGQLAGEIGRLKGQGTKDLMVYGGSSSPARTSR